MERNAMERNATKHIVLWVILLLCMSNLKAQVYDVFEHTAGPDMSQYVTKFEHLRLVDGVTEVIQGSKPSSLLLKVDQDTLNLYRTDIFSPTYRLRTDVSEVKSRTDMLFYWGTVQHNTKSLAAVSIIGPEIRVMYADSIGVSRIHQVGDTYLSFNDSDVLHWDSLSCTAGDIQQQVQQQLVGNCVEIYFECDYKSYQDNGGSVPNTEAWVAALFNEVAILYVNEDIPVTISDIKVWTSVDPYASLNSTGLILNEFVDQTSENGYDGRLAHLLSTRPLFGGIAYVNVLCHPTLACGVSTSLSTNIVPFPNYSWSVNVVTHELGHNFGSRHTHDCVWNGNNTQIDDCGSEAGDEQPCYDPDDPILPDDGTIMSYCHLIGGVGINFNLGFGPQPGALILNKYLTAPCNTGCPIMGIGITTFEIEYVRDCVVRLAWIAEPDAVLYEGDGETWYSVLVGGDNTYTDYTPSKFYRLQSGGASRILSNYEPCSTPYWIEGSTLHINIGGYYEIYTIDGRRLISGYVSGGEIGLTPGMWVITLNDQSKIVSIF